MIIKLAVMRSRIPAALETAAFACHRVFGDRVQVDALPGMTQSTASTTTYSYMALKKRMMKGLTALKMYHYHPSKYLPKSQTKQLSQ
jgi:hypothetical protein